MNTSISHIKQLTHFTKEQVAKHKKKALKFKKKIEKELGLQITTIYDISRK